MSTGAYRDADATVSAKSAVAVTKSDSTVLATTRALYIGVTGNVAVVMAEDSSAVTFIAVPVGILPVQVTKVMSTNTTASSILALY